MIQYTEFVNWSRRPYVVRRPSLSIKTIGTPRVNYAADPVRRERPCGARAEDCHSNFFAAKWFAMRDVNSSLRVWRCCRLPRVRAKCSPVIHYDDGGARAECDGYYELLVDGANNVEWLDNSLATFGEGGNVT